MSAFALKRCRHELLNLPEKPLTDEPVPTEVSHAQKVNWGVFVDAYLMNAARVGNRIAAVAYADQSGLIANGTTVATAPVRLIASVNGFKLFQTLDANDYYVLVTEMRA